MAHSICCLKFNVTNEIPVVFHNSSKYDFHLIIKEPANEFDGQFDCISENSEKNEHFVKIDKDGNKTTDFISYKKRFIDGM